MQFAVKKSIKVRCSRLSRLFCKLMVNGGIDNS